jgi:sugar porter (SP) family MFS transporter
LKLKNKNFYILKLTDKFNQYCFHMFSYPVRIALIASLGGFLFGFDTAVISGAEEAIQKLWSLSSAVHGFTIASGLLGTVLGAMIAGIPAKKYGRKKVLFGVGVLFLLAAVGCALTSSWFLFVVSRISGGVAVGASSVVGPMYIAEIAPAHKRGRLVACFQLNIVVGILAAFLSNYAFVDSGENAWRWMMGIQAIPAVVFIILLRQIPESPRWLVLQHREDESRIILSRTGELDVEAAISAIHASVSGGIKEKLFSSKYAKPIFFAVLLAMFNQLSGINAILYYAPRIFELAGVQKGAIAFQQAIFVGAANLVFTLLAMTFIDRFGRKTLLLIGSAGMVIFLGLTSYVFGSGQSGDMVKWLLVGFIAFFAFSQGAVIWVFISEIFPNSVRSQGQSLGSSTHWVMDAIITWTFPIIVEGSPKGGYYSFLFYTVMMALCFLFVWKVLPETKGKSLESIQKELGIS